MAQCAEKIMANLKSRVLPSIQDIKLLCMKARDHLIEDPNVIVLQAPLTIVGDIHGQFYDLMELFEINGECPDVNYCFLGDYVDRGKQGVETFLFLLALKVRYPTKITLLRGNHECRAVTQTYGFYDECIQKYGHTLIYSYCTDIFDLLPLAATVNDLFLVHGGLSPDFTKITDINGITRIHDLEEPGLMADLCWSDPDIHVKEWGVSPRGIGFLFGRVPVQKFNHINNKKCIVRAHQLCQSGYDYLFDETVLTIFSAPNYCYRCGNEAAILEIDEYMNRDFKIFEAVADQHVDDVPRIVMSYFL